MEQGVQDRFDRLEAKVDRLSAVIEAMARVEERITHVLEEQSHHRVRMDGHAERIRRLEDSRVAFTGLSKLFWVVAAAVAGGLVTAASGSLLGGS